MEIRGGRNGPLARGSIGGLCIGMGLTQLFKFFKKRAAAASFGFFQSRLHFWCVPNKVKFLI